MKVHSQTAVGGGGGENISAVKGVTCRGASVLEMGQFKDLQMGGMGEDPLEDSVIWTHVEVFVAPGDDGFPLASHSWVDHGDMDGVGWEGDSALRQDEGGGLNVSLGDLMREVDDLGFGVDFQHNTTHRGDIPILEPEIRRQCDDGTPVRGSRSAAHRRRNPSTEREPPSSSGWRRPERLR